MEEETGGPTAKPARAADTSAAEPELIEVQLADDHIAGFAKARKPILALAELIWNALDADAANISVDFAYNRMEGLECIVVRDDGHGMDPGTQSFGSLGGSAKRTRQKTPGGRTMHGKEGKGRFRAFALGTFVEWVSRYRDEADGIVKEWSIGGDFDRPKKFTKTRPQPASGAKTGTTVTISNVSASHASLTSDSARNDLLLHMAPYLRSYPGANVTLDGKLLDVDSVIANEEDFDLTVELGGHMTPAKLNVIDWSIGVERRLIFCSPDGISRYEEPASIHAKGYDFTAYVMSEAIAQMSEADLLLGDLDPRIRTLGETARETLRRHFKDREAEKLAALVDQWKAEGTYPYADEATTPIVQVERGVFDILAVNVHQRIPGFDIGTRETRGLTFKLLRQALTTNPSSLHVILSEVLKLPKQEQDDFAEILQRTKLSGIVRAAKVVTDRMKFLDGLKDMLFDAVSKKLLKERSQLQRILVEHLWVFGEGYYLGLDDQNLKALLAAHANILGRKQIAEDVKDITGEEAIPDLMLYRQFPDRREGHFDHLVVELKRPSVKAGQEEINQIQKYAFTVQKDARFDKTKTRWTFVLIVNDVDEIGDQLCTQSGREYGHIYQRDNLGILVKKWSNVLQECQWRHEFFRKQLEVELQDGDGRAFVEKKHAHFLPKVDAQGAKRKPRRARSLIT